MLKTGDIFNGILLLECPASPIGEHVWRHYSTGIPFGEWFCSYCHKSITLAEVMAVYPEAVLD